ncbi:MAG: hypothetical protein ACRDPW_05630 [Mycobacteriales bacterium]
MSVTVVKVSRSELAAERARILAGLGVTADEIAGRAQTYTLTTEQAEAWDRLRQIAFLLGDQ